MACVTSGARSNEIELWIKLLTGGNSETWRALHLTPPPSLYGTSESSIQLISQLRLISIDMFQKKSRQEEINTASQSVEKPGSYNSDKVLLWELFTWLPLMQH